MDIECAAVSEVMSVISATSYLRPFINSGDKEPSWDGFIYVYSDKKCKKSQLQGRVAAQVKGKKVKKISKKIISYSVQIADLKNYLHDGGVFYFIVYLTTSGNKKIYYSILLPFDIKEILQESEKQETISIKFNEFPNNETAKCELFINFLENKKSQSSLLMISDEDYQTIKNNNKDYNFSLFYTTLGDATTTFTNCLFKKELYLYVELSHGIKIPINKMTKLNSISSVKQENIYCDGKSHYSSYKVIQKETFLEFCFGQGIIFELDEQNHKVKISCNIKGTLNQQIEDIAFFIDLVTKKTITIGANTMSLKQGIDKIFSNLKYYKNKLVYLEQLKKALNIIGNKTDLDLNLLEPQDWRSLDILIQAFVKKQPVAVKLPARKATCNIKIGNISLVLLGQKPKDSSEKCRLINIFENPPSINVENSQKEKTKSSAFCFFEKNIFLTATNIDYDVIFNDIKNKPAHKMHYGLVNKLILNLLLAFDESKSKNIELLNCAQKLTRWLYEQINETNFFLNYLQALKRSRALNHKERNELHHFIENNDNKSDMVLTGIYILLDDFAGAELHYEKLSEKDKNEFVSFPIYNLWNRKILQET